MKFQVGQKAKLGKDVVTVLEQHRIRGKIKYLVGRLVEGGYMALDRFVAETELEEIANTRTNLETTSSEGSREVA